MSENKNCVLIGLPKSGKSTFVAALWHVVESSELESSLTITSLPADRVYLNEIRNNWLSCSKLNRNKVEFLKHITLEVEDKDTKIKTNFGFPDLSGEMYNLQFESRRIKLDFIDLLQKSNGIILFVNPELLKKPILISDVAPLGGGNTNVDQKEWEHKDSPTQVVLVDILQMLLMNVKGSFKIAVVISAWDTILNTPDTDYNSLTPNQWLEREMPLLSQFLETNNDLFKTEFFGISAQGGDYTSEKDELHGFNRQSERIKTKFGDEISNDITLPIRWLIND
jgi:hypothetical protein